MLKIKKILKKIISSFPFKRIIVFESRPDYSDNTKAVFDEMVKRGLNNKYKLVWLCYDSDTNYYPVIKNVLFINHKKAIARYYILRSKALICCNHFLKPSCDRQFSIYLCHGNPIKNTKEYYLIPADIKYILASSTEMGNIRCNFYGYDKERIIPLGYPRNDVFANAAIDLQPLFKDHSFRKVIVWYPTFRQGKTQQHGYSHSLPLIWDNQTAIRVNECAKENNVLIVLKPHFAQDVSKLISLQLSNLVFINDNFFTEHDITSYQFVGSCDALITDYSSIYYDYTLCDKPIGLIWEDYEEYSKTPGFAVDMSKMMKGGVKIYNFDDFISFICDISQGVDRLKEERRIIRDYANYSTDGKNSKRVVDFIIEKAKL